MKFTSNLLILLIVTIHYCKKVDSNIIFKEDICEWTFENLWNKECIKINMDTIRIDKKIKGIQYYMALGTYQNEIGECKDIKDLDCLKYLDNTLSKLEKCTRPENSEIQKVYEYLKAYTTHYKFICNSIDCPFAKFALIEESESYNKVDDNGVIEGKILDVNEAKKVFEDTCSSNISCIANTKEYLETLNKFNIILPASGMINRFNETIINQKARKIYEEGISYLSDEKCTPQSAGKVELSGKVESSGKIESSGKTESAGKIESAGKVESSGVTKVSNIFGTVFLTIFGLLLYLI